MKRGYDWNALSAWSGITGGILRECAEECIRLAGQDVSRVEMIAWLMTIVPTEIEAVRVLQAAQAIYSYRTGEYPTSF